MIIAVDGPSGAGKSTVAKILAQRLGFLYIDTGAMYRALTLKALEDKVDLNDAKMLEELAGKVNIDLRNNPDGSLSVFLDGKDVSLKIRQPQITRVVSDIAKVKEVRRVMVKMQAELGKRGSCVLDGRDIGTVVFPQAERKFYIDASMQERVNRRFKELKGMGEEVSREEVNNDLANRDKIDSSRPVGPLKKAADAIYIDTTNLSIEEVLQEMIKRIA